MIYSNSILWGLKTLKSKRSGQTSPALECFFLRRGKFIPGHISVNNQRSQVIFWSFSKAFFSFLFLMGKIYFCWVKFSSWLVLTCVERKIYHTSVFRHSFEAFYFTFLGCTLKMLVFRVPETFFISSDHPYRIWAKPIPREKKTLFLHRIICSFWEFPIAALEKKGIGSHGHV